MPVATCESELGGANPPELFSAPASGPPMAPAMTTNDEGGDEGAARARGERVGE